MVNIFAFRSAGGVGQEQLFSTSFGSRKCTFFTQGAFRHIKMEGGRGKKKERKEKVTFNSKHEAAAAAAALRHRK